ETPKMTLFIALNRIREEQDPSLQFDFVCREAICGSCGMLVNGKPELACRTLTSKLPNRVTLLPLPGFKLIGDLSVDTGAWFRSMNERVESWIHTKEAFDPNSPEARMSNDTAQQVFELERCIECGCCLAACTTRLASDSFLGPAGLLRVARFMADPRDQRTEEQLYDVLGNEEGIFGCVSLMACDDYCPKDLPLQTQLAYLRRKMLKAGLKTPARS
ncbi:MAG: fumarate reductase iron-sulfur subunit, partial [Chloroflexota bacterium]|nr:fumarate reductase iron-sulfur subunit [Chloroflexota bacterium]